ncbi:Zinc finger CCCH domain-containing protein 49, partial [Linum perenne]
MYAVSTQGVNAYMVHNGLTGTKCLLTYYTVRFLIKSFNAFVLFSLKRLHFILFFRVNDPVAMKLLNKAGEMPSLEPPEDESIRTLYVGGLDERISEQDLRDNFYAHGEIESIKMVPQRAIAFVAYTTREGAEKATEELSNELVIKGLRLKLMLGRPQAPKPNSDVYEEARQQELMAHGGMMPRAVISQHNQPQPPGLRISVWRLV